MSIRNTCRALSLVALAALQSSRAFGQSVDDGTRNAARSLASQGKEAFDKAEWELARDMFHRAYTLVPAPTIALFEARALSKLRRLVEAEEAYMRAARTTLDAESSEPFRKAVHDAEDDLLALRARMPKVTIVPSGPGARNPELNVTLDGRPLNSALLGVELPIDPGDHTLAAVVRGTVPIVVPFSAAERQAQKVDLLVPSADSVAAPTTRAPAIHEAPPAASLPPEPKQSSWQAPAALVAGGVGAAGVVTGIITGLMAGSRYSQAGRQCPDRACVEGSAGWNNVKSFRTLRAVSTVGYIVGGIGVAGGAALFLTAPRKTAVTARARSVDVWLTASSVGLAGAF